MERLTKQSAKFLRKLMSMEKEGKDPSDHVLDVIDGKVGTTADYNCILELANRGFLAVDVSNGNCQSDIFMPIAREYAETMRWEGWKTVGRYAFNLLVGACGGLIVYLLGQVA